MVQRLKPLLQEQFKVKVIFYAIGGADGLGLDYEDVHHH